MALTPSPELTPDEQYALVYQGITAVAARCDGALSEDGIGFNGQDTHFGRRIASVSFEEWTPEIRQEAARIAGTYRQQIENYLGFHLNDLPVVREANEWGTNHTARNQARAIERGAGTKALRKARKLADGRLVLTWDRKDPECFGALLAEVKRLPGRRWTGSVNEVDFTPAAIEFIEEFGLDADFDLSVAKSDAADVLAARQEEARIRAEAPKVTLHGKRVRIDAGGYNPERVADARNLPGRTWLGGAKVDEVDIHPAILTFAKKWNLKVAPEVVDAINNSQADKLGKETVADLLTFASRQADPENLPPAFEALVNARLSAVGR